MVTLIAVDESGDLGFNFDKNSSKYLIFAFYFIKESYAQTVRDRLEEVKDYFVKEKKWPKSIGELKFSLNLSRVYKKYKRSDSLLREAIKNKDEIRETLLRELSNFTGTSIKFSIVNKTLVSKRLREDPGILYNYALVKPIHDRFINNTYQANGVYSTDSHFKAILDKNLPKTAEKHLNDYLANNVKSLNVQGFAHDVKLTLEQKDSTKEELIWISDFLAGAMHQKLENSNSKYYDIIEHLIDKDSIYNFFEK